MEESNNFSVYGGYDDEVFDLAYYEGQYYRAPQVTSDSGCNVPEFVYSSEYYVQNIQVSYPVIPVVHGGTTYFYYPHLVYLPVCYYVPVYFTYQDPIGFEEASAIQDNSFAGVRCDYACDEKPEEYGIGVDYTSFKSVCVPEEVVSPEITFCYNFEEFPEKLCDAPANSDTGESSSETEIEQASLSVSNKKEEIPAKAEKAPALSRSDSTVSEDEDIIFLYDILSSLNVLEVKEDMRRNYNNKKNKLYDEVLKGYMKNIQVSYPVIPVVHGGTTYFYYPHLVYLPVCYYVPVYFTYQDPIGFEEASAIQDNSFAGVRCDYACDEKPEEYGIGVDYTSFKSVCVPEEVVSPEITFCYNFEEFPEKLCDAPANSDTGESSSETEIEQASLSVSNKKEEIPAKAEKAPALSRSDSTVSEDEDIIFLYDILSSLNVLEVKEDMRRNYNNKKNKLYDEVLKGYMKKENVLKQLNWEWVPFLPKIPEETKRKKTFDMKKYYFDDCLRIPRREPRYEEESEKFYLYQMLGSLKLDILDGYMEENYNKGKEKRYRRACKGYRTKKKHLKELQWESTTLGPIPEDEELQISKKEFKKNFRKDLKNIALQNESWGKYLAGVLKKSVPTSTPISGETQKLLNEEDCTLDNQQIAENPQLSMPSSVRIDNPNLVTPNLVLCKKRVKFEFQEIDEHPHPYVVFPDRMEDNIPAESTFSLSKAELNCESQIVEESHPAISSVDRVENGILETTEILLRVDELDCGYQKIFNKTDFSMNSGDRIENERLSTPDVIEPVCESQKIVEESQPAISSADRVENGILETTEILLREDEIDGGYYKFFDETDFSTNSEERIENERLSTPDVIEHVCESQKIVEESHPAISSADRVENGILETTEILLREEELDDGYHKIFDETEFSMNSEERIENERLSVPGVIERDGENEKFYSVPAILEPPTIAAASEINNNKKRFSSLRKFLSRICCCKKTPPS